jgi:outer membrane protein assembly factor BamB
VTTAPTIDASGVLYVGTEGDGLYAIDPEGTVRWHFDPGVGDFMRPVIGEGRTLYVGTRVGGSDAELGRIYALGE